MPITTLYRSRFFLIKKVSAEKGPLTLIPLFFKDLIDGIIIFSSSLKLSMVSQCGFKPSRANLGVFFKNLQ